jgi:hypothetical protein
VKVCARGRVKQSAVDDKHPPQKNRIVSANLCGFLCERWKCNLLLALLAAGTAGIGLRPARAGDISSDQHRNGLVVEQQPTSSPSATEVRLKVDAETVIHTMRGGLGASWHAIEQPIPVEGDRSHGGSAWGGTPPADDNRAWSQIYRHADWLGLDFVRVELEQRMFEPEQNRYIWDSPEMRILYRILDWCETRHADVFLQCMWGNVDWNTFPEFRVNSTKRVHSGPCSMTAFADGLATLMQHLVRSKHYTCIRWLCINNEPGFEWSWWQRPPNEPMSLREGLAAVRHALDQHGITVPLSGPDWTDLPELKPQKVDFDEFIGAYDLHSYFAGFDWHPGDGYPMSVAERRLQDWCGWSAERNKPLFLSELGTMIYGWRDSNAGPSTWEAAIKDAELVVRALNLGLDGFNRWSFINRGDLDGIWQMIDTWDPQQKGLLKQLRPRPNAYFVYGLISRLTAKHSSLVRSEREGGQVDGTNRVFSAALKSPGGNLTWIVVNDAPQHWKTELSLTGCQRPALYKYQVIGEQKDRPGLRINPVLAATINRGQVTFLDALPPMSLTIFSTWSLNHSARGIVEDRLNQQAAH